MKISMGKLMIIGAVLFCLIFALILFVPKGGNDNEQAEHRLSNVYLSNGKIDTISENIDHHGYYTSTGRIKVTFSRIGGISGELTIRGGDMEKTVTLEGTNDSFAFSGLDKEIAYTFEWDGIHSCSVTISE